MEPAPVTGAGWFQVHSISNVGWGGKRRLPAPRLPHLALPCARMTEPGTSVLCSREAVPGI